MSPLQKIFIKKENTSLGVENQDVDNFINMHLTQIKSQLILKMQVSKLLEMRPYGGLKGFKDDELFKTSASENL